MKCYYFSFWDGTPKVVNDEENYLIDFCKKKYKISRLGSLILVLKKICSDRKTPCYKKKTKRHQFSFQIKLKEKQIKILSFYLFLFSTQYQILRYCLLNSDNKLCIYCMNEYQSMEQLLTQHNTRTLFYIIYSYNLSIFSHTFSNNTFILRLLHIYSEQNYKDEKIVLPWYISEVVDNESKQ